MMTPAAVRQEGDRAGMGQRDVFAAIVEVESGGNCNAVNYKEGAIGPVQIREACRQDCNAQLRHDQMTTYSRQDCFDLEASRQMFYAYCRRYRAETEEEMARQWNGGPMGMHKKTTVKYWAKVKAALEAQK
jgi:hypothetical protein